MIKKLSEYFTEKLLANGTIPKEEQELYIYGFFMLISQMMYLILACILGLIFGCLFESIIFYISFQFIRRYAGGYHAATETRCEIMSALSILACVVVIKLSKTYDFQAVLLGLSAVSALCIAFLCPLDTPEKPLSEKEVKYFRKISLIILLVIIAAVVGSCLLKFQMLSTPCCMSLILEAILITAGKIKKSTNKN